MEVTTDRPAARDGQRAQASQNELVERIMGVLPTDGTAEPLRGVQFHRASARTELGHGLSFPFVCVIAQGSKELLLGDRCYRYDPGHYLIATAALPVASQITQALPEHPYLSLRLTLDPTLIGSVMVEAGPLAPRGPSAVPAIDVSPLDVDLLDAVVRLVRLRDCPAQARVLAPLLMREIVFRLLLDAQGGRLQHIAALGGATHRIVEAIERLRHDFDQPLRVEDLAREFGMSASGFHHHFRTVTALSPLQFQKHLRLQEARHRCATWNTYGKAPRNVWVKERLKSRASVALVCMRVGA